MMCASHAMRFCAYCGQLEVLVGGKLGDDRGKEGDHPKLSEEDQGEDGSNQDNGSEDTFHVLW